MDYRDELIAKFRPGLLKVLTITKNKKGNLKSEENIEIQSQNLLQFERPQPPQEYLMYSVQKVQQQIMAKSNQQQSLNCLKRFRNLSLKKISQLNISTQTIQKIQPNNFLDKYMDLSIQCQPFPKFYSTLMGLQKQQMDHELEYHQIISRFVFVEKKIKSCLRYLQNQKQTINSLPNFQKIHDTDQYLEQKCISWGKVFKISAFEAFFEQTSLPQYPNFTQFMFGEVKPYFSSQKYDIDRQVQGDLIRNEMNQRNNIIYNVDKHDKVKFSKRLLENTGDFGQRMQGTVRNKTTLKNSQQQPKLRQEQDLACKQNKSYDNLIEDNYLKNKKPKNNQKTQKQYIFQPFSKQIKNQSNNSALFPNMVAPNFKKSHNMPQYVPSTPILFDISKFFKKQQKTQKIKNTSKLKNLQGSQQLSKNNSNMISKLNLQYPKPKKSQQIKHKKQISFQEKKIINEFQQQINNLSDDKILDLARRVRDIRTLKKSKKYQLFQKQKLLYPLRVQNYVIEQTKAYLFYQLQNIVFEEFQTTILVDRLKYKCNVILLVTKQNLQKQQQMKLIKILYLMDELYATTNIISNLVFKKVRFFSLSVQKLVTLKLISAFIDLPISDVWRTLQS